jgi:hypothetical protein
LTASACIGLISAARCGNQAVEDRNPAFQLFGRRIALALVLGSTSAINPEVESAAQAGMPVACTAARHVSIP